MSNRVTTTNRGQKLAETVLMQFRKGSHFVYNNNSHDNTPFVAADFLRKKTNISTIPDDKNYTKRHPNLKEGKHEDVMPSDVKVKSCVLGKSPNNDDADNLIDVIQYICIAIGHFGSLKIEMFIP
ncbi:hypothetical protein PoB_000852500 [Plakobranchus ocellatus]|uniref:Uncharacterized protein n=1 Tax=Plakobranchus ocellatus TaxID=259542 RepID=A0AAV3YH12_9GAST|nr:hypothetical protein PoB_000852500 [Plakobranchus ocellatus]